MLRAIRRVSLMHILSASRVPCSWPAPPRRPHARGVPWALSWLTSGETPGTEQVSKQLGNGIAATDSCVTSIYIASRFVDDSFLDMQSFVAACGGDVDTIGAMAGAVWGAANGASSLPSDHLAKLEKRDRLRSVAGALHGRIA